MSNHAHHVHHDNHDNHDNWDPHHHSAFDNMAHSFEHDSHHHAHHHHDVAVADSQDLDSMMADVMGQANHSGQMRGMHEHAMHEHGHAAHGHAAQHAEHAIPHRPIPGLTWNVFRYAADWIHLAGVLILIFSLIRNRHTRGLSLKTQLLFLIIFLSRYLDLFTKGLHQSQYLFWFKLFYISTSALVVFLFYAFGNVFGKTSGNRDSYEQDKDTFRMEAVLTPCFIFAFFFSEQGTFVDILWTFSEYLEGFAMVPQYIFSYREDVPEHLEQKREAKRAQEQARESEFSTTPTPNYSPRSLLQRSKLPEIIDYFTGGSDKDGKTYESEVLLQEKGVMLWICCIGFYRIFYALNWVYHFCMDPFGYRDYPTWFGGAIQIMFFYDFLCYQFSGGQASILRNIVLSVDEKVNEVVDKVELKVMPSQREKFELHKTEMMEMRKRRVVGKSVAGGGDAGMEGV